MITKLAFSSDNLKTKMRKENFRIGLEFYTASGNSAARMPEAASPPPLNSTKKMKVGIRDCLIPSPKPFLTNTISAAAA